MFFRKITVSGQWETEEREEKLQPEWTEDLHTLGQGKLGDLGQADLSQHPWEVGW